MKVALEVEVAVVPELSREVVQVCNVMMCFPALLMVMTRGIARPPSSDTQ